MSDSHGEHDNRLAAAALDELHKAGFQPEFSAAAIEQLRTIQATHDGLHASGIPDLGQLPWSSIDNDTSRDLDQLEVAERVAEGIRIQVAIADVAALVAKDSPIDQHAAEQTQTVYTAVRNFPMLPLELSTDLTSLNEDSNRQAVLMSFTVSAYGAITAESVSRAWVRNGAQLAYSRVGPWLERLTPEAAENLDPGSLRADSAPLGQSRSSSYSNHAQASDGTWLATQLQLQDEAARALHSARVEAGALDFHRSEADPIVLDGRIAGLHEVAQNRAMRLIEELMVAANGVMARAMRQGGRSGLQRIVRTPKRWDRIVALAGELGTQLPATPDPVALNRFLQKQRASDPDHYPDLALAVIKLMGAGQYILMRPEDSPEGHFGLAARDYAHSTAPNRRYIDLVTQRILHAMLSGTPAPYTDEELTSIATRCNQADTAIRKIDRDMQKRVAAIAMTRQIGHVFSGVVTGASPKGVYVRVLDPPFEGRLVQGEAGLDVGMRVQIKLIHTDPDRAFIDFARVN